MTSKVVETQIKFKGDPGSRTVIKTAKSDLDKLDDTTKKIHEDMKAFATGTGGMLERLKSAGMTGASIAVGITAVSSALRLVGDAARAASAAMGELLERGGATERASAMLRQLGSSDVVGSLNRATAGLISQSRAIELFSDAARSGLSDGEITEMFSLVTERARDMGASVEDSLEAVASGLEDGDLAGAFDELGISIRGTTDGARGAENALDQLRGAVGAVSPEARSAAEAFQQLNNQVGGYYDQVAEGFSQNESLLGFFEDLGTALADSGVDWRGLGRVVGEVATDVLRSVAGMVASLGEILARFASDWAEFFDLVGADESADRVHRLEQFARGASTIAADVVRRNRERGSASRGYTATDPNQMVFDENDPEWIASMAQGARDAARARNRGGRGGGGGADSASAAEEELQRTIADAWALTEQVLSEELRVRNEIFEQRWEQNVELSQQENDEFTRRKQAINDLVIAEREAAAERRDQLIEIAEKEREARQAAFDRAMSWSEAGATALDSITQTVGAVRTYQEEQIAAVTEVMEAQGKTKAEIAAATQDQVKQVERLKKAEGAFLVAYEVVQAAIEAAKAIGAYPDVLGIVTHAAASVAHGVAAGLAAARLGGGSASVPTVSTGVATQRKPQIESSTADKSVSIINVYSLGRSDSEVGRALERAQWTRTKQGLPSGGRAGIAFDA